jgi:hypothetical protein
MRNVVYILCLVFYSVLFWQEGLGINLLIFSFLSLGYLRITLKINFRKGEILILVSLIMGSIGLLFFHSAISIVVFFAAFVCYLAYLQAGSYSVLEAFVNSFISLFSLRTSLLPQALFNRSIPKRVYLYLRIAFLPLVVFFVFFSLFMEGNKIFRDWAHEAFGSFFGFLDQLDTSYLFFLALGLFILRGLFKQARKPFLKLSKTSFLERGLKKSIPKHFKTLSLKKEYLSAVLLFLMLNLLLLVINFIDIKWVWFQFYLPESFSLKEFVHEGVGYLLVSLLFSTSLVFYYFRANLNFYPKSRLLKFLAQLWLLQNAILALSVARRTFYYIGFHGLANRRLAVIVLISIILVCLGLLVYKLATNRNNSFVFRQSSAFVLLFFAMLSLVNWDQRVAHYNIQHGQANEIDVANYLNLSPRVFPYLYDNLDRIAYQIEKHQENEVRWVNVNSVAEFEERLNLKKEGFIAREKKQSWRSWNYAEAEAFQKLKLD